MADFSPLFADWGGVIHAVVLGILAYLGMFALMRFFGKGMQGKNSAPSFILTVSLGGGLAGIVLLATVSLAAGLLGFATLMFLQFVIIYATGRSRKVNRLILGEPVLVFYEGRFLKDVMRKQGISEGHVLSAMRKAKAMRPESVWAVVFENNGKLSVIPNAPKGEPRVMEGVKNFPPREQQTRGP